MPLLTRSSRLALMRSSMWPSMLVFACLALGGCAAKNPTLHLMDPAPAARKLPDRLGRVEVEKVQLPQYATQPEIAMQAPGGALKSYPDQLWADTPADAITRILADQISEASGATAIAEPWPLSDGPDRRLSVRVGRIYAGADGRMHLVGRYFVAPAGGVGRNSVRSFDIAVPLAGTGAQAIARAQAAALAELARQIARLK